MEYGSLFSGIGGADLGLDLAGMECAWQVEQDEYRRQVLERHWPGVARYEDVRSVGSTAAVRREERHRPNEPEQPEAGRSSDDPARSFAELAGVSFVWGGVPCQDFSVAGKRAGLTGLRGTLFYEYRRVVAELRPRWFVMENVPGILTSSQGRDWADILTAMGDIGYKCGWRVLDSRYFHRIAQRRRRVYLVGHLGNGAAPLAVLFEPEGSAGNSAAGQEAGEDVARPLGGRTGGGSRQDLDNDTYVVASPLTAADGHHGHRGPRGDGLDNLVTEGVSKALSARPHASHREDSDTYIPEVAFALKERDYKGVSHRENVTTFVAVGGVRRLTPLECERLQGFPDHWSQLGDTSDQKRYSALGDAQTVSVARWLGERIMAVDAMIEGQ